MRKFSIPSPCSENWNEMSTTEKGAFCQKCAHEVNDVTKLSNGEIRDLFRSNKGKRTCVRMTINQESSLNRDAVIWDQSHSKSMQRAMLFSLLVVFGLTLFSCTNPRQAQELNQLRSNIKAMAAEESKNQRDYDQDVFVLGEIEPLEVIQDEIVEKKQVDALTIEKDKVQIFKEQLIDEISIVEDIEYKLETVTMGIPAYDHHTLEIVEAEIESIREDVNGFFDQDRIEFSGIAFPNPATTGTTVSIDIPDPMDVFEVRLLDMNGRTLNLVYSGEIASGTHEYRVGLIDLKPGTYLFDILYGDQHEVVRIVKI